MFKFFTIIWGISALFGPNNGEILAEPRFNTKSSDDILRDAHFRVYGFDYPPLMYPIYDGNGNVTGYQGSTVGFINYLTQYFNLKVTFVPEDKNDIIREGQGRAGIVAVALSKKVDLSTLPMQTEKTSSFADFTNSAYEEGFILLCPWPEEESRLAAIIKPFDLLTWMMLIVSTIALILFATILISLYFKLRKLFGLPLREKSVGSFFRLFGDFTMYVISILCQQSNRIQINAIMSRLSLRLMIGFWLFTTIVLIDLYGSTLTSYLTLTKLKPIPNSLEELAENYDNKKCLITLQKGHIALEMFKNSKYPPYEKVYQWVTENPQFLTNEYNEITENVVKEGCIHLGTPLTSGLRVAMDFKSKGKCRMSISKTLNLPIARLTFALQKNSPYTQFVNKYLLQAKAAGLMDYWKKWSYSNINLDVCKLDSNSKTKLKPIKLIELSSAFFLLVLGIALSTFVFLLERIVWLFNSSKKVAVV